MRADNTTKRRTASEFRGILLVLMGLTSLAFYFSWWLEDDRLTHPVMIGLFVVAIAYSSAQIVGSWFLYLATHHRSRKITQHLPKDLSVDVVLTSCGEDHLLIQQALTAARNMKGNHRTWLLDDAGDPKLAKIAANLGVGYLAREGNKDKKAGNINAALPHLKGDVVAIFDIDHTPKPNFLTRTLPHFSDPLVGFVQVMLTFENQADGWIARAAADTSLDFYNPTCIGADSLHGATLVGTNAVIRRQALEQIGGYKPGLAEDLATSLALHSEGWKSVYVSEPLAPGFAPPDATAWFTQQLKWARGVFELLLTVYPRSFVRLTWGQWLSYLVRTTYYWAGPVFALHLLTSLFVMWQASADSFAAYQSYLIHLFPVSFMFVSIRGLALRRWQHSDVGSSSQIGALALVVASWPAYTLAWILAISRRPLSFRHTPKRPTGRSAWKWLAVTTVSALILLASWIVASLQVEVWSYPLVTLFVLGQTISQLLLLLLYQRSSFYKLFSVFQSSANQYAK